MKQILEKQTVVLEKIEKVLSQDRLIQLSQAALENKSIIDADRNESSLEEKLASIQEELKKALTNKTGDGLNSNFTKLFEEAKKQTKLLSKLTPEQGKAILDKSRERKEFKTLGSRLQGAKEGVKDLFTTRGFLDKTGIVKRGSGGILSEYLDAREDTKKYAKLRVEAGDPTVRLHGVKKATQIFEKQRREQQNLRREQGTAERKIAAYKAAGISEQQIASSPESKKLQETAVKLAKVDPSVRPEGFDVKTGMIATAAPIKQSGKKVVPNPIPPASKEGSTKKSKIKEAPAPSQEDTLEAKRASERQLEVLMKIEENTSRIPGESKAKKEDEKSGGGSILSNIISFLGESLMAGLRSMFSLKNILKVLGKVALPAMIIGSLVNGIMDGFKTFSETGSITEALIDGLGGVLEFLTFGLFDAKTLRNMGDAVSGFVDEFIIAPVKNFFTFIGDTFEKNIVKPLADFFEPIASFFKNVKNQMLSMVESIGIPEISFTIPIIDKKVSIGPFYPFKRTASATLASSTGEKQSSKEATPTTQQPQTTGVAPTAAPDKSKGSTVMSNKTDSYIKIAGKPVGEKLTNEQMAVMKLSMDSGNTYPAEIMQKYEAQNKEGKSSLQTPPSKPADVVYNKSAENVQASSTQATQQPIIISAPTTNNTTSKQNITMPKPVRNDDSGFNRYLASHSAII